MANEPKQKDVLADFRVAPARKVQYESNPDFTPVGAPEISDDARVVRGKRVRDGLPAYFVQDGAQQPFALPLSCASAVVAGGLLTVAEIVEMWDDKSRAAALKMLQPRPAPAQSPAPAPAPQPEKDGASK